MGGKTWRVYLSGPMEGCTKEEMLAWRQEAVDLLSVFARSTGAVVVVISPKLSGENENEDENAAEYVEQDKCDIAACDFVLVNPWKTSAGTSMEVMYAYLAGKRVVTVARPDGYVNPWIRYHSWCVTESVRAACSCIKLEIALKIGKRSSEK